MENQISRLLHQENIAGTLDRIGDLTVKVCRHSGHAPGEDLATFGGELLQKFGILEVDRFRRDVEAAMGHGAVSLAEITAALWCLWCAHSGVVG